MARYLNITENATTIEVEAAEWKIVFDEAKGGTIDTWYQNGGNTNYANTTYALYSDIINPYDIANKYLDAASNSAIYLIENSIKRVRIFATGELSNTSGYTYEVYFTVYSSGYIFVDFKFINNTGTTLNFNSGNYKNYTLIGTNSINYTNKVNVYANNDTSPHYGTESWYGMYSTDELNSIFYYVLFIEDAKAHQNSFANMGSFMGYYSYNGYYYPGDWYRSVGCIYIGGTSSGIEDIEADGAHIMSHTRQDADLQYTSPLVDFDGPMTTISGINGVYEVDGSASDGARHVDTYGLTKITYNQTEPEPSIVEHNRPMMSYTVTASGVKSVLPKDHLGFRWDCEDQFA